MSMLWSFYSQCGGFFAENVWVEKNKRFRQASIVSALHWLSDATDHQSDRGRKEHGITCQPIGFFPLLCFALHRARSMINRRHSNWIFFQEFTREFGKRTVCWSTSILSTPRCLISFQKGMPLDTSTIVTLAGFGLVCVVFLFLVKRKKPSGSDAQLAKHKNVIVTLKDPDTKYPLDLIGEEEHLAWHASLPFSTSVSETCARLALWVNIYYLTSHINGELVKRPYTPTTSDDNQGYFDLVIKVYPNGKMTQYLEQLAVGQPIDVSGPSGNLIYRGKGMFDIRTRKPEPYVTRRVRRLGMIAGGSGITPMYQILNEILKEQASSAAGERVDINIWLLFANQTEQDILLRDELEQLAAANADRFQFWYTVDRDTPEWKYSKGFINDTMISEHLPPPGDDVLICLCGPPPMIKFACSTELRETRLHRLDALRVLSRAATARRIFTWFTVFISSVLSLRYWIFPSI